MTSYDNRHNDNTCQQLRWESLKQVRKDNWLIILYINSLKDQGKLASSDLISQHRLGRKQHPVAFHVPFARMDIHKSSFFPVTIRDRNVLSKAVLS